MTFQYTPKLNQDGTPINPFIKTAGSIAITFDINLTNYNPNDHDLYTFSEGYNGNTYPYYIIQNNTRIPVPGVSVAGGTYYFANGWNENNFLIKEFGKYPFTPFALSVGYYAQYRPLWELGITYYIDQSNILRPTFTSGAANFVYYDLGGIPGIAARAVLFTSQLIAQQAHFSGDQTDYALIYSDGSVNWVSSLAGSCVKSCYVTIASALTTIDKILIAGINYTNFNLVEKYYINPKFRQVIAGVFGGDMYLKRIAKQNSNLIKPVVFLKNPSENEPTTAIKMLEENSVIEYLIDCIPKIVIDRSRNIGYVQNWNGIFNNKNNLGNELYYVDPVIATKGLSAGGVDLQYNPLPWNFSPTPEYTNELYFNYRNSLNLKIFDDGQYLIKKYYEKLKVPYKYIENFKYKNSYTFYPKAGDSTTPGFFIVKDNNNNYRSCLHSWIGTIEGTNYLYKFSEGLNRIIDLFNDSKFIGVTFSFDNINANLDIQREIYYCPEGTLDANCNKTNAISVGYVWQGQSRDETGNTAFGFAYIHITGPNFISGQRLVTEETNRGFTCISTSEMLSVNEKLQDYAETFEINKSDVDYFDNEIKNKQANTFDADYSVLFVTSPKTAETSDVTTFFYDDDEIRNKIYALIYGIPPLYYTEDTDFFNTNNNLNSLKSAYLNGRSVPGLSAGPLLRGFLTNSRIISTEGNEGQTLAYWYNLKNINEVNIIASTFTAPQYPFTIVYPSIKNVFNNYIKQNFESCFNFSGNNKKLILNTNSRYRFIFVNSGIFVSDILDKIENKYPLNYSPINSETAAGNWVAAFTLFGNSKYRINFSLPFKIINFKNSLIGFNNIKYYLSASKTEISPSETIKIPKNTGFTLVKAPFFCNGITKKQDLIDYFECDYSETNLFSGTTFMIPSPFDSDYIVPQTQNTLWDFYILIQCNNPNYKNEPDYLIYENELEGIFLYDTTNKTTNDILYLHTTINNEIVDTITVYFKNKNSNYNLLSSTKIKAVKIKEYPVLNGISESVILYTGLTFYPINGEGVFYDNEYGTTLTGVTFTYNKTINDYSTDIQDLNSYDIINNYIFNKPISVSEPGITGALLFNFGITG